MADKKVHGLGAHSDDEEDETEFGQDRDDEKEESVNTEERKFSVVVAIDCGTSASGSACGLTSRPKDMLIFTTWPGSKNPSPKTLTAVLMRPDNSVVSFGEKALRDYTEADEASKSELLYFDRFKMCLSGDVKEHPILVAANGATRKAVVVFAAAIGAIRKCALDRLRESTDGLIKDENILWVLTVPATWSEPSKQIMIEGVCYIVADLGGGTGDFAGHQLGKGNSVKEILRSSGGPWGSTFLDKAFMNLLDDIFTAKVMSEFQKTYPSRYLDLLTDWDTVKSTVSTEPRTRRIRLPLDLIATCNMVAKNDVEQLVKEYVLRDAASLKQKQDQESRTGVVVDAPPKMVLPEVKTDEHDWVRVCVGDIQNAPVAYSHGDLRIAHETIIGKIFSPTVVQIVSHIKNMIREMTALGKHCSYVFLVGGFSESEVVRVAVEHMLKTLDGTTAPPVLIRPANASHSVLAGAVLSGLGFNNVTRRIVKHTYGIQCATAWKDEVHGKDGREKIYFTRSGERQPFCNNVFSSYVCAGTSVPVNKVVSRRFYPSYDDQTTLRVSLWRSSLTDVAYCDHSVAQFAATLEVNMSDLSGGLGRVIQVDLSFGRTHIEVVAFDVRTGTKVSTRLDFLDKELSLAAAAVKT